MEINVSICTYNNGTFDVMFEDKATGKQLCFSGDQKLDDEDFETSYDVRQYLCYVGFEYLMTPRSVK